MGPSNDDNLRILLVDDNPSIHEDFKKILTGAGGGGGEAATELDALSDDFFGDDAVDVSDAADESTASAPVQAYEIRSALQGQEALALVQEAEGKREPFAMAFVDVRMPPGWDGIKTIAELWKVDPDLQVVVCTAFSDYSYDEILDQLGRSDQLLILKKPFDAVEVQQMALALTAKRNAHERERRHLEQIQAYTASLETVNRALASDKAMAEAYSQSQREFIKRAGTALGEPAHSLADSLDQSLQFVSADPQLASIVRSIAPKAGDLADLIDQIVDLTDLEAGEARLERDAVDFFGVLATVEQIAARHAELCGTSFVVKQRSVLPETVVGDPERLRSLFENLVRGSIDLAVANSDGATPTIEAVLSLEREGSLHHDSLVLEIHLPTVRLTPSQQQALFEPFDESTTGRVSPRLYLPLARQLSRLHGSSLDVRAGDGAGAVVRLELDPGSLEGVELKLRTAA